MDDDRAMCEHILRHIESILQNDPDLKEVTIIPSSFNVTNKSPVLYEEHTIGLESWCVKHIYRYAYMELFEQRQSLLKNKLSFRRQQDLNHFLIGALLINPDVSTFWNMKRELVQHEVLSVDNELLFTKIVLSHRSKSNETFAYRRWICERVLAKASMGRDAQIPWNTLQNEFQVTEMAAEKSKNNYHAWTHRIWAMDNILPHINNQTDLLLAELEFSYRWILSHVSEHTCYHYRQYLFESLLKNKNVSTVFIRYFKELVNYLGLVNENDPKNILCYLLHKQKFPGRTTEDLHRLVNYFSVLLLDLFQTLDIINNNFPNHETSWYYRRYLVYSLLKILHEIHDVKFKENQTFKLGPARDLRDENVIQYEVFNLAEGEKLPKQFKSQPNKVEDCYLYKLVVKTEEECIKKCAPYQRELVRRHERWLRFFVNLDHISY